MFFKEILNNFFLLQTECLVVRTSLNFVIPRHKPSDESSETFHLKLINRLRGMDLLRT